MLPPMDIVSWQIVLFREFRALSLIFFPLSSLLSFLSSRQKISYFPFLLQSSIKSRFRLETFGLLSGEKMLLPDQVLSFHFYFKG